MSRGFIYLFIIISIIGFNSCNNKIRNINYSQLPIKEYSSEELKIDDLFLQACTQKEIGNKNMALELLDKVIELDPNYSSAYFQKSDLLFSNKEIDQSIINAKKSIESSPKNLWYKLQLAEIYIKLNKWEEASLVYEKIIDQSPETIEYYQELVEIYHNYKDEKSMIKTLDKIERKWGISEDVSMFKFKYFTQKKDYYNAEKEVNRLIETFPQQTKYLAIMAEIKMNNKEYSNALEYYKNIESLDPDDPFINVSLTNYYLIQKDEDKTYSYLEKAFENKDLDYNTKIQILFTIYGNTVDNDNAVFAKFFELLKVLSIQYPNERAVWELLSTGYIRVNDFDNAIKTLKKSIFLGSIQYEIYQNLLFAESTLNIPDSMIIDSQFTIELFPEQPLPYLFLGVNYMYKEEYEKANQALLIGEKLVVDNKPLLEDFYSNIGECYYKLNDYENSDRYFDKTLELNPLNYLVLNNYAYYLSLRKVNLDKAEKMAKKTYDKYPDNPIYVDTYAWVLYENKKFEKAKEIINTILDSKSNWSETLNEHYEEILKATK